MTEKDTEKADKIRAQKKLQLTESQLKRYKKKAESVQELKRNINDLKVIKETNERADERYLPWPSRLCG